jgi:hemerythrin
MAPFSLTQDLITGIPAIDEQHGELLDLANEVVTFQAGTMHPELFDQALTFLLGYSAYHFVAEEAVMTELEYPERDRHFDNHRRLQRAVADVVAEARIKGATEACKGEVARFLNDWIVHHIRESDREMATFLRSRPIDPKAITLPDVNSLKSCRALMPDFDEEIAAGVAGLRLSCSIAKP